MIRVALLLWSSMSNLCRLPPAVVITVLCVILANCLTELLAGHAGVLVPCVILFLLCVVCIVIIWRQPESKEALSFKVTAHTSVT